MVTIKMVAARCGLSVAAVSRALNFQPGVGAERAEWIRQVAKEMGYVPNAAARALKTNRTNIIGVLYHNRLAHEFFSVVLEGIHEEAERWGYEITFLNRSPEGTYYDHARQRRCAGVVVAQGLFDYDNVMTLIDSPIPTVSIENQYPGGTTVTADNENAMREVVHYLHGMGHRRIACIHGEAGQVMRARLAGFLNGCEACGISVPEAYIRASHFRTPDMAADETRALLALPEPPTCILYPDDVSYLGGMAEIERQGLSIPGDVSCVGFDGVSMSRALRPRLTTWYQDAGEMGAAAVREIIRAIEDPKGRTARVVTVPGRLQPGDTVRRLGEAAGASV